MAAVASQQFWDDFFQNQARSEWYFSANDFLEKLLSDECRADPSQVVLHAGIGNAIFDEKFFKGTCLQFDFSLNGLKQIENKNQSLNLFVANALALPLRDNTFDLIIEKGLFDSVTGRTDLAIDQAFSLLCEYHRCLKTSGKVLIFSLFGPSSDSKDMLGLLRHPGLSVESRDLFVTPAEIPSQDFCFVYIVTKQSLSSSSL
jgi:SAM-dependent methyltransferase